ncbi:MAG: DOMON domain-containing protein [Candidatus Hodarchaeales archaeon]
MGDSKFDNLFRFSWENIWLVIGIEPSVAMLNEDLIFGWVSTDNTPTVIDAYSLNSYGSNHLADTTLGGTDDILTFNGTEVNGITTLEIERFLVTEDTDYDNDIPAEGTMKMIWAIGGSDSFSDSHIKRGSVTIDMKPSLSSSTTSTITTTESKTEKTTSFELGIVLVSFLTIGLKRKVFYK